MPLHCRPACSRCRFVRLALPMLAICSAATAQSDRGDFISSSALSELKLVKYWQLQLQLEPTQSLQSAYLVDDQIYACTTDGYVFAIHARTGALRWIQEITESGYKIPRPCHYGNSAAFVLPPEIRVFNRQFGDPLERRKLRGPAASPPVSDGERIYFGGVDRRLYAFGTDNLFERWKVLTEGQLSSGPAIFGDYLYFASEDGRVYACRRANKVLQWKAGTYAPITADLLATEDGVYVASRDHSLYLYDILFGQVRWRVRLSGPLYEPPVVAGEMAYQFSPRDGVVAIHVPVFEFAEERIAWKLRNGRSALTADEQYAYVLMMDETVAVVAKESGEVRATIAAPGMQIPLPDPATTSLMMCSLDGRIFCARPADAPYVRAEEVQEALRATSQPAEGDQATSRPATSQPAESVDADVAALKALRDAAEAARRTTLSGREGGPAPGGRSKVSKDYGKGGEAPR